MAHITEIKIEGLLGRHSTIHYKLQRDVNIFFGSNGSGKTTLLKVLDAAMNLDSAAIERLPVSRAEVHIFSLSENRTIKHVWDRKVTNQKKSTTFEIFEIDPRTLSATERMRFLKGQSAPNDWKRTPPKPADSTITRWAHQFLPTTRLYLGDLPTSPQASPKQRFSEDQLDAVFAETVSRAWLLFNARVSNEVRLIQGEGLRAVLDFVLAPGDDPTEISVLDHKQAYASVLNFLQRQPSSKHLNVGSLETFKRRYSKDKNLQRVVGNLDNVERRIEVAIAPIERFKNTLEQLFSNGKTISPSTNALNITLDSGAELSPAALSSGEKHLLKLLLTAMTAEENAVIIDEPELSMHIDWQRTFVSTVHALNPDCQLILATHSPEIMAEIGDEKIFKI